MWNERYNTPDYFYGTEPNDFVKENAHLLGGPVLSLGEGEGRNGVYLASRGLDVLGVDGSDIGLAKAQQLATSRGLTIRTEVTDLSDYAPAANSFGAVISIFAHLPSSLRATLYPLVERALKPGGIFLLESYSKSQLARDTGGPKDVDMLLTSTIIEAAFPNCEVIHSRELDREVMEGIHHFGLSSVVQFIARKK